MMHGLGSCEIVSNRVACVNAVVVAVLGNVCFLPSVIDGVSSEFRVILTSKKIFRALMQMTFARRARIIRGTQRDNNVR